MMGPNCMATQIYLVFTDDWELRGDGSGDPTQIQFRPLQELARIFAERSIRGSFNAEIMQQLTFRSFQDRYPHLKDWADEWERVVTEAFHQGHDFQLHIHPQWKGATYDGRRWILPAPWSILEHPRVDAARMIAEGIKLLQGLLQPICPGYRCVSFRAGAWWIAPSGFMLDLLASQDIRFDMSIVRGISYNFPVQLDYRHAEEGFFPFYPDMCDARRIANKFCTRNNSTPAKLAAADASGSPYRAWVPRITLPVRVLRRLRTYFTGRWLISDLANLDYDQLVNMMRYIRAMARRSETEAVPVILANHTKDIT